MREFWLREILQVFKQQDGGRTYCSSACKPVWISTILPQL